MNDKKICIISFQNQENQINSINIPNGYEIEEKYITNETNIAKAYNEILNYSDAKYKIYLQEGVRFSNKNVLQDILNIFLSNNKIGMIGIAGAETIPTSGVWQESIHKYGKYFEMHKKKTIDYNIIEEEYKKVKAIDKIFMATQYDFKWREDLFDDRYFYDTAQCVEFIRFGYEIVVPRQDEPWCIIMNNDNDLSNKYKVYKEIFLQEYSKDIFPLVSILIPAYNRPELFKIALESAINQTYKNIEIVIGDDSTNDGVKNIIQPYLQKYKNIRCYNNGGPLGDYGTKNNLKIFDLSNGELINYLMDDDIFHKDKIMKMANFFIEYKEISLVSSYRKVIDENGNELEDIEQTKKIINYTGILNNEKLLKMIFLKIQNIIGEPTSVLFRKKDVLRNGFGKYCNKQYLTLEDVATWISLLQNGDIAYIAEPLSYFRIHSGQNENKPELMIRGVLEWFNLINDYRNNKELLNYKQVFTGWIYLFISILNHVSKKYELKEMERIKLYNCYNYAIKEILDI